MVEQDKSIYKKRKKKADFSSFLASKQKELTKKEGQKVMNFINNKNNGEQDNAKKKKNETKQTDLVLPREVSVLELGVFETTKLKNGVNNTSFFNNPTQLENHSQNNMSFVLSNKGKWVLNTNLDYLPNHKQLFQGLGYESEYIKEALDFAKESFSSEKSEDYGEIKGRVRYWKEKILEIKKEVNKKYPELIEEDLGLKKIPINKKLNPKFHSRKNNNEESEIDTINALLNSDLNNQEELWIYEAVLPEKYNEVVLALLNFMVTDDKDNLFYDSEEWQEWVRFFELFFYPNFDEEYKIKDSFLKTKLGGLIRTVFAVMFNAVHYEDYKTEPLTAKNIKEITKSFKNLINLPKYLEIIEDELPMSDFSPLFEKLFFFMGKYFEEDLVKIDLKLRMLAFKTTMDITSEKESKNFLNMPHKEFAYLPLFLPEIALQQQYAYTAGLFEFVDYLNEMPFEYKENLIDLSEYNDEISFSKSNKNNKQINAENLEDKEKGNKQKDSNQEKNKNLELENIKEEYETDMAFLMNKKESEKDFLGMGITELELELEDEFIVDDCLTTTYDDKLTSIIFYSILNTGEEFLTYYNDEVNKKELYEKSYVFVNVISNLAVLKLMLKEKEFADNEKILKEIEDFDKEAIFKNYIYIFLYLVVETYKNKFQAQYLESTFLLEEYKPFLMKVFESFKDYPSMKELEENPKAIEE